MQFLRTSQRFHKVGQGLYNIFQGTQKMLRDFFILLYSKKPKKPRTQKGVQDTALKIIYKIEKNELLDF